MPNPFDILGLQKNASMDDIQKAYKKKAFENHPDRGGSEEEFKKINQALHEIKESRKPKREHPIFHNFNGMHGFQGGFSFNMNMIKCENVTLEDIYFGFTKTINGMNVNVPAGISSGDCIKIPNQNLTIKFNVLPHPIFKIEGKNLSILKNISIVEALTGYKGHIDFLKHKKIHIETQANEILHQSNIYKIPNLGLPNQNNKNRGDLLIHFKIKLPQTFDENKHESLKFLFDHHENKNDESVERIPLQRVDNASKK